MRRIAMTGMAAALLGGGCALLDERYTFEDEGAACAMMDDGFWWDSPQEFEADEPLTIRYIAPTGCLSTSNDVDRSARCEVALRGGELVVHSEAAYTHKHSMASTADCGTLTATCTTPPLAEGRYDLLHGDGKATVEVPSSADEAPCSEPPDPW